MTQEEKEVAWERINDQWRDDRMTDELSAKREKVLAEDSVYKGRIEDAIKHALQKLGCECECECRNTESFYHDEGCKALRGEPCAICELVWILRGDYV